MRNVWCSQRLPRTVQLTLIVGQSNARFDAPPKTQLGWWLMKRQTIRMFDRSLFGEIG